MIALKTSLNGKQLSIAGAEDLCVLNSIVNVVGKLGELSSPQNESGDVPNLFLTVGGLTARANGNNEHLRWTEHQTLSVGDEIKINVVEVTEAEIPTSRSCVKSTTVEDDKMRYENAINTFLDLKCKYGDEFPLILEGNKANKNTEIAPPR